MLRSADFVNLRIESEIALELGADLPASGAPWTSETVAPAVAAAMAAFELIEDRNADYAQVEALSLIVENCWNAGVVIGAPKAMPVADLRSPAKATPRTPAPPWPGSPIMSPNAAAGSKPV